MLLMTNLPQPLTVALCYPVRLPTPWAAMSYNQIKIHIPEAD